MIELVGTNELERHMWLENLLKQGTYEVTFTKIDGSTRTMPCTLNSEILPVRDPNTIVNESPRPLRLDTLAVFVTDIQEWRSFRVMNVIEIKPI